MTAATIAGQRPFNYPLFGQALESRLGEMFVEGKRGLDSQAFHHHKRYAVGQRIAFTGLVREFAPCLGKYRFIDVHEGSDSAGEQRLADFDRFGVMPSVIEKRHDLVEHIRGRNERNAALADFTPDGDSRNVVLIVRRFQRNEKPRVEEIGRYDPLYRCAS